MPVVSSASLNRDQSPEVIFSSITPLNVAGHNNNVSVLRPVVHNRQRHASMDSAHSRIHSDPRGMGTSEGRYLINLLTDEDRISSSTSRVPQPANAFRQPFVKPRRLQDAQPFMNLEPEPEKQTESSDSQDKLSPETVAQIIATALAQSKQFEATRTNSCSTAATSSTTSTAMATPSMSQRAGFVNATPFPIPEGWRQVRLPEHRCINGIPSKSRDPMFMVMHASVLQQQRLSSITKINSLFCKERIYDCTVKKIEKENQ